MLLFAMHSIHEEAGEISDVQLVIEHFNKQLKFERKPGFDEITALLPDDFEMNLPVEILRKSTLNMLRSLELVFEFSYVGEHELNILTGGGRLW